MPRYYFHIHDGVSMIDDEGTELAGWTEAKIEAIRLAGSVIKDEAKHIALGEDWRIEVTDERGLILFRFDFVSLTAPALGGR